MSGIHEREANVETFEATVDVSANVNFGLKTARLIITNDDGSNDLRVEVGSQEMTLKPKETITLPLRTKSLIVRGATVPYRIWGFS